MTENDIKFMREALRQAKKGIGRTSPNPMVGAVIVKDDHLLSAGYHRKAGADHAEVEALKKLDGKAPNCTMYVTLEPCNHYGRTPPCTESILRSGIDKVVIGMLDPNLEVKGGGATYLKEKGLQVKTGVLEQDCRQINDPYIKFISTGRPFVAIKTAMTLDGWTATASGHSEWITSEKSRRFVHRLRDQSDAVLVGVGTVIADNPKLTTRLNYGRGKDAVRIILDSNLNTPPDSNVANHHSPERTIIVTGPSSHSDKKLKFKDKNVTFLQCPINEEGIDFDALLTKLGELSITNILVEGGSKITGSLLKHRLVDKIYAFIAPKLMGGNDGIPMAVGRSPEKIDNCIRLHRIQVKRFNEDILIFGYPEYPPR